MKIKRTGKIIFGIFVLILLGSLLWIINQPNDQKKQLMTENENAIQNVDAFDFEPVRGIDKTDWTWGKEDAPLELIVYNDLSCLFCNRFNEVVEQIKKEFPDQVRIAYRHYPLDGKPESITLSVATECAGAQDKFQEMYQGIMKAEEKTGSLEQLITDLKLDEKKFEKCLTKDKNQDKVMAQKQEALRFGVLGAPSSFLNEQSLPGAYQFEDFQDEQGNQYSGLKTLILQKLSGQ